MKKIIVLCLMTAALFNLTSMSLGGGISVFIPESKLTSNEGNVSIDSSLGSSLSFGNFLSVPFGVSYNQVHGLTRAEENGVSYDSPVFYADSLSGFLQLKVTVPLSVVYFEAFGGGIVNYNFNTQPYTGTIESYLGSEGMSTKLTDWDYEISLGTGWSAGAGFGVIIDQINVGVYAEWREVYHTMSIDGQYYQTDGSTVSSQSIDEEWTIVLSGLKAGIKGNFSF